MQDFLGSLDTVAGVAILVRFAGLVERIWISPGLGWDGPSVSRLGLVPDVSTVTSAVGVPGEEPPILPVVESEHPNPIGRHRSAIATHVDSLTMLSSSP